MMLIEAATAADAATLARLNEYVHTPHVQEAPRLFKSPTREAAAPAFGALVDRDDVRAFIASADGRAIGYILVYSVVRPEMTFVVARRSLYVDQIAVEPGSRRRGVGRELLAAALAYARSLAIHDIEVETWVFNEAARAFFRSAGFGPRTERSWMRLEA